MKFGGGVSPLVEPGAGLSRGPKPHYWAAAWLAVLAKREVR
jgi:hypothetical protein